ncbi:MAG: hypothetical protein ACREMR_03280 [Gemmatimonadales bacterium]
MPPNGPASPAGELDLTSGDPLDRLQRRLHLKVGTSAHPGRRIVILLAVTVLPLVALAAIGGQLVGLAEDTLVVGRLVIGLPLLVLAGPAVGRAVRHAVEQCTATGLVAAEHRGRFDDAIARAIRMRDSRLGLGLMVAGAVVTTALVSRVEVLRYTGEWGFSGGRLTPAGWWYVLVSLVLYNVVRFRWLWRLLVWWRLLFHLSRIPMRIMPAHPDRAGGLGLFSNAAASFALAILGLSLGGGFMWRAAILAGYTSLTALKVPMVGLVIVMLLLVAAPLVFFLPHLGRAKRRAEVEYGRLAARYTRRFDARWLGEGERHDAELLGTGDIQSLADLAGSYDVVRQMRPVPLTLHAAVALVLAAALAMLPAIEAEIPLKDILLGVLGALR